MKVYIRVITNIILLIFLCQFHFSQVFNNRLKTIVIDPGHGGHDPGAVYGGVKEKDITLSIALKLRDLIRDYLPDVTVILTREKDEFVELYKRTKIANDNKADLFISIHVNASRKKESYGFETYVMGLSKSESNLEVAIKENSVILKEQNYKELYDGFDPYSPEAYIIFSLYQNANLDLSIFFGNLLQNEFKKLNFEDRGIKQAGFLVLWKTTMPSILIEIGFLSNEKERNFLKNNKNHLIIAKMILNAIIKYKNSLERTNISLLSYKNDEKELKNLLFSPDEGSITLNEIQKTSSDSFICVSEKFNKDSVLLNNDSLKKSIKNILNEVYNDTIYFLIQIMSSSKRINRKNFPINLKIEEFFFDNSYKYMCCRTKTYQEAVEKISEIRKIYPDAFIVSILNGRRISIQQALSIINERNGKN